MKTIVVFIKKSQVKSSVRAEVAYLASKQTTSEADVYDSLRMVKEDDGWMDVSFDRSLTVLFSQLSPWLRDKTPGMDVLLSVPLNFDEAQQGVLWRLMCDYLKNMIVSDWLSIHPGQETAEKRYDDLATGQMELIRQTLNKRVRPKQPKYDEVHEIIPRRKHPEQ